MHRQPPLKNSSGTAVYPRYVRHLASQTRRACDTNLSMEQLSLKPARTTRSVHHEIELAGCTALIVEGDNTTRSVLATQLRDFGLGDITQCSRVHTARETLEQQRFDFVLCTQYFGPESPTGQDLLDELQRDALLPLSTVFIMVTAEASYAKVEQAAESALDGYLLKPYSAASLVQRLLAGRRRKLGLRDIFQALEGGQLNRAISLCEKRFAENGAYGLYCARVGAELMLRVGRHADAARLYQSVAQSSAEPWAKAGIARALLSSGQLTEATALLETITNELPDFADAFDVLGRAQLKLGQLHLALASFRRASGLTPSSVGRLQRLGLLAYYLGDASEAEQLLEQATRLGHDTRAFDYQTLALLALLYAQQGDHAGLLRCRDLARGLSAKIAPGSRLRRVQSLTDGMAALRQGQFSETVACAKELGEELESNDFDFDLACVLLGLMALLAEQEIRVDNAAHIVSRLTQRFCTSDATLSLLLAAAKSHEPYVLLIRQVNDQLLLEYEGAMKHHLEGDNAAAILGFAALARSHLNARALEAAQQLFLRHGTDGVLPPDMGEQLSTLRARLGVARARPNFADPQGRPAAAMALRISAPTPDAASNW